METFFCLFTSELCPMNISPLRPLQGCFSAVASGKLKACTTQPVQVCHNVTFLVDLQDDPMDVRADENGVWDRKGSGA